MPVVVNEPVNLAGAAVLPGDCVFADEAGAVIVPAASLMAVLHAANEIRAKDRYYLDAILWGILRAGFQSLGRSKNLTYRFA